MAKKKPSKAPKAVRDFLAKQLRAVAKQGGKARWVGVSAEERKRISSEAGKKSAAARAKKKKLRNGQGK